MDAHKLIHQDSGVTEYGTPKDIIDRVKWVMGGIGLDVATSKVFNDMFIKAGRIFTITDNALKHQWCGKVWMNHPFGRGEKACPADRSKCQKKICARRGFHIDHDVPGNEDWIAHFVNEWLMGRMTIGMNICYAATSEAWFRPLKRFPQCYLDGRTNYLKPDGKPLTGVTKGSVVTYLGPDITRFADGFRSAGEVKVSI